LFVAPSLEQNSLVFLARTDQQYLGQSDPDTLRTSRIDEFALPADYKLGLSIEVPFNFYLAADFTYQDWTKMVFPGRTANLQALMRGNLGVEWTPNFLMPRAFLQRISYRGGLMYERGYLALRGQSVDTWGVTFGLGIPAIEIKSREEFSTRINLGVGYFNRGTQSEGLVQEGQWRFVFGVSFVQTWFQRRKYN
jgi:hypothetical protein